jgi:hypothetical protein
MDGAFLRVRPAPPWLGRGAGLVLSWHTIPRKTYDLPPRWHRADAGGIFNYGGTLTVSGCTLSGNSGAGGIVNEGALTVSGCTLSGDSADLGGGIAKQPPPTLRA